MRITHTYRAIVPAQDSRLEILYRRTHCLTAMADGSSSGSAWGRDKPAWQLRYEERVDADARMATQPAVDDSDEEEDLALLTPLEASQRLYDMLVKLKERGRLSARDVCTIAFWAKAANVVGAVCDLALSPAQGGGNHSKHYDKVTGLLDIMQGDSLDTIWVPGYDWSSLGRSKQRFATTLAHQVLADEIMETRGFWEKLDSYRESKHFGRLYHEHPDVVCNPDRKYVPLAVYLDGVAIQTHNRDSGLGIWVENMVTHHRHLLVVHRKRHRCRCGCRGWCTYYVLMRYVAWQLANLRLGRRPPKRWDNAEWSTGIHQDLAGQFLGFYCLPILLRGDWLEFSTSLGFCSWSHKYHPCFDCFADCSTLALVPEVGSIPWPLKTQSDYENACNDCEITIHIPTAELFRRFMGSLQYNRSKGEFSKGRMVTRHYELFGLRKNPHLRLEPSDHLFDIGDLDNFLSDFPHSGVRVTLWDPTKETGFHHRCPLISTSTGLNKATIAVDELHVLFLGLFPLFVAIALWRIILVDGLSSGGGQNVEDSHILRGQHLRHLYFEWVKTQKAKGNKKVSVFQEFDLSKLGSSETPNLTSAKGAQAGTMLFFVVDMLKLCHDKLDGGGALLTAGQSLIEYIRITRKAGRNLTHLEYGALCESCIAFLEVRQVAGLRFIPKMHLFAHLVFSSDRIGNPKIVSSTWHDETLNADFADVAMASHPLVWSRRTLAVFSQASGPGNRFSTAKRSKNPHAR